MRIPLLSCTFLIAISANAVLTLEMHAYNPLCNYNNGTVVAYVTGGTPPYSYLWNTGDTGDGITGLGSGTYSVIVTDDVGTQVSDQATLYVDGYSFGGPMPGVPWAVSIMNDYAYRCPGETPILVFSSTPNQLTGTEPFTIAGYPVMSMGSDLWQTYYYGVQFPGAGPGLMMDLTMTDANGCTSQPFNFVVGDERTVPTAAILDVQGACGTGGGYVTVGVGSYYNGGESYVADLETLDSYVQTSATINSGSTALLGPIGAGDYQVRVHPANVPYGMQACGPLLPVTVPDLGVCATLSGNVYVDNDADCIMDAGEYHVPERVLEFQPGPLYATTGATGYYSIGLPFGNYTVTQVTNELAQNCPAPVANIAIASSYTQNFGDNALVAADAHIAMSSGPARPGFQLNYGLRVINQSYGGTGSQSVTMTFDPLLTFTSASPVQSSIAGNTITWNFPQALGAFQDRYLSVSFQVPPDVGLIGTDLLASASVSIGAMDGDPTDNTTSYAVTVTGSFDPNEKVAQTSTRASASQYFINTDEWIDYTIRFQNTGTDTAFAVVVTDTLPATLDPSTIEWSASSHRCLRRLEGSGVVKFIFNNIQLPDSNVNEPASHGFVSFRIRPHQPLVAGTVIENTANIFFDFNDPVITEPSVLTAEFSTGAQEQEQGEGRMLLMPNPVNDRLSVSVGEGTIDAITILAADGREVLRRSPRASNTSIDVSGLCAGSYFLIATMDNGSLVRERFCKQ